MMGAFEIDNGEIDANDLLLAHINGTVIVHANRQIYAQDNDFLYKLAHNKRIMQGSELLSDKECIRP